MYTTARCMKTSLYGRLHAPEGIWNLLDNQDLTRTCLFTDRTIKQTTRVMFPCKGVLDDYLADVNVKSTTEAEIRQLLSITPCRIGKSNSSSKYHGVHNKRRSCCRCQGMVVVGRSRPTSTPLAPSDPSQLRPGLRPKVCAFLVRFTQSYPSGLFLARGADQDVHLPHAELERRRPWWV